MKDVKKRLEKNEYEHTHKKKYESLDHRHMDIGKNKQHRRQQDKQNPRHQYPENYTIPPLLPTYSIRIFQFSRHIHTYIYIYTNHTLFPPPPPNVIRMHTYWNL